MTGVFSYLPANFIIYFAVLQGFLVGFCIFIIIKFYIFASDPLFAAYYILWNLLKSLFSIPA
ncbi:MAG TPA: hypothetical protein DDY77_05845 [Clostridiales bacterium]|nr:hypothetical protein [Clostridiales bacterium]